MDKKNYLPILLVLFCLAGPRQAWAQFTVSGQLRTRTELRNGQGTLQVKDTASAIFTSQRTRLNFGYSGYRFKLYASVQDVRVWGQDASSINRVTSDAYDGFMLHEAWAEISLVDTGKVIKNFTLKIGRQELVYDDVRLLGNLDWLQQARRHDAALIKFDHNGWTAHLGAAYNQNAERKSNTIYNGVPTAYTASTNGMSSMYKSMQFLYLARKHYFGNTSLLFFKDDFSKFHFAATDTEKKTPIYESGVWSRYTMGANMFGTAKRKLSFALSAFYQGGKYRDGTSLSEYLLSASAQYAVGRKLSVGPGVDITSGNNGSDPTKKYQRFDPLYGTPHKFWGYMDYFYVADGFGSNGLIDYYLKAKYKLKDNFTLSLDGHRFVLPSAVVANDGSTLRKALGTEIDFVFNYAMTKTVTIEGGYSTMFSTSTMASAKVKNVNRAADFSDWAYLMISIKPEFTFKN
ncbi:MAG TPA: alginate export family protein [Ohtaekwangia sp.]|uniref:alginate export family protein n=1 Tax=Ohtaekwangia sp. TaxID=2066019 RepID=UPI002F9327D3